MEFLVKFSCSVDTGRNLTKRFLAFVSVNQKTLNEYICITFVHACNNNNNNNNHF